MAAIFSDQDISRLIQEKNHCQTTTEQRSRLGQRWGTKSVRSNFGVRLGMLQFELVKSGMGSHK
jgi:hypothetical protein